MHLARFVSLPSLAIVALAALGAGCGKESACFHWTEIEGACPARDEALTFFQNPNCTNSVRSVDSDPDFDGELCCYDVTALDTDEELCSVGPSTGAGGPGVPGPGKPVPVDPGSGGAGPVSCSACVDFVINQGAVFACPGSDVLAQTLLNCMCGGSCTTACSDNACNTLRPNDASEACSICLQDTSATGCGTEVNACVDDSGRLP